MVNNNNIALALMSMVLIGCSKASFTPGEEPANTKGLVWFAGDYERTYYFYDQPVEGDSIYIFVHRADTTVELTVDLLHEGPDYLRIPDSIHFPQGSAEVYIPIDASPIRMAEPAEFSLRIPDEYANPYTIKDGACTLTSSILWSTWTRVSDTVLVISAYDKHPRQGCQIENFRGANVFRITDFLGSGNPLIFSLSNKVRADDLKRSSGMVTPLTNFYYPGGTKSERIWDWSNDGNWTPFTPKGGNIEISYVEFGWGHAYYESSGGYDNFDFSIKDTCSIKLGGRTYIYDELYYDKNVQMVYVYSTTGSNSYWDYLDFLIGYEDENENED